VTQAQQLQVQKVLGLQQRSLQLQQLPQQHSVLPCHAAHVWQAVSSCLDLLLLLLPLPQVACLLLRLLQLFQLLLLLQLVVVVVLFALCPGCQQYQQQQQQQQQLFCASC
jgi:hypothetical protein